jgi:hypothetical protein
MPVPVVRRVVRTVQPYPLLPTPIYAPTTTIPQPKAGPKVGAVPLFSTPKPKTAPILKNPLFYAAVAVVAWYLLG